MLFTDKDLEILPLSQSETIPSSWYCSKEIFDFELKAIFEKSWQYVCHKDQLKKKGDTIISNVSGNPILVVNDDEFKAFYNVCKHRGGPILTEACNVKIFQCKYHGWTYKLDGSLRGVPRFNFVELFDKKDYGLKNINLSEWDGLIFIKLANDPISIDNYLNGIKGQIFPQILTNKIFYKRISYEIKCNWKVYVDNYLEGYHIPFVHPSLNNILDMNSYETKLFDNYSLQFSPIVDNKTKYGAGGNEVFYYFIFPNIMLNILPGRLQVNIVEPIDENNCIVHFDYLYDEISTDEAKQKIEEDINYSDEVQKEDIMICEHVQIGLRSKAYDKGRFSVECEAGVHHFQTLLKKRFKESLSDI